MMTTIIPAADVGKVIFQELQEFAIAQYGTEGEKLLTQFLDSLSFQLGV
jgi:hypothetical protein